MAHDYDDKKQVLSAIAKLSKDGSWVSPLSVSRALDISLVVAQKRLHWLNDEGELEVMAKNNTKFYRKNQKDGTIYS